MTKIKVDVSSSRPLFIEADAEAFGEVFAAMSSSDQVAVFAAMVWHMKPHRTQWDHISIELEATEANRAVRDQFRAVLFPEPDADAARLAWLEEQHTLHGSVEFLYVVDGYTAQRMRDGSPCGRPYDGATLVDAIDAMRRAEVAS
ncbi:hypothetical protein EB230_17360 [Mesorhizobium sp. NZP2234]|uniref:hypothetical protein n=1 Tax=Mesorhizobium sp. NZP2234 TaxID=2483402 RepID=UPI001552A989|nr:hypothetical protein [Mesorhizobium sp. NZP2234]QKC89977.1 hypothetical protein EB230_17360 [Mesorhizobium sp. NZP2234]